MFLSDALVRTTAGQHSLAWYRHTAVAGGRTGQEAVGSRQTKKHFQLVVRMHGKQRKLGSSSSLQLVASLPVVDNECQAPPEVALQKRPTLPVDAITRQACALA